VIIMADEIFQELLPDCPVKHFKRNEIIYNEGDTPHSIYFIEDGLVGLSHIAKSGKETSLRVFGNKAIFGHSSYIAIEKYHATTIALTETSIKILSLAKCEDFLKANPKKLQSLLASISKDLGAAEIRLAGLQDKSTDQRIAESLTFLKLKY